MDQGRLGEKPSLQHKFLGHYTGASTKYWRLLELLNIIDGNKQVRVGPNPITSWVIPSDPFSKRLYHHLGTTGLHS